MPNPLLLFGSAVLSQVPAIPGAVSEDGLRWALQTGGFGALFALVCYMAMKWLSSELSKARDSENKLRDAEIETLKGVIRNNNDFLARLVPVLDRIEGRLNRVAP